MKNSAFAKFRPYFKELLILATVFVSGQALAAGAQLKTEIPAIEVVAVSADGLPVEHMTFSFWVLDSKYGWHGGMDGNPFPEHGWYNITLDRQQLQTGADGRLVVAAHTIETDKVPYLQGVSRGYFTIPECGTGGYNTLFDHNKVLIQTSHCEFASSGTRDVPAKLTCSLNATAAVIAEAYEVTRAQCIH